MPAPQTFNNPPINSMTTKELSCITDSLKNEQLLTKLCTQAAVECQNPQLKSAMAQLAQERFNNFHQLISTLQQQANYTH
ncbi:MAG TPA: hypothetical protein VGE40_02280 [Bacilli bacterium]